MLGVFLRFHRNKRGRRVRLQFIVTPLTEFNHSEKDDALYSKFLYGCVGIFIDEFAHELSVYAYSVVQNGVSFVPG